jgi:hypothetical protein
MNEDIKGMRGGKKKKEMGIESVTLYNSHHVKLELIPFIYCGILTGPRTAG